VRPPRACPAQVSRLRSGAPSAVPRGAAEHARENSRRRTRSVVVHQGNARDPPNAGALANLDHAFLTVGVGMVMNPSMGPAINAHLDPISGALEPCDSGVNFANFVDVPIDTRTCYPRATFDRLQDVKARYAPHDLIRANHPIPCSSAAG